MGKQVKTYRVLKDGMKVGNSVRYFNDFMPEAKDFQNLRAYLRSDMLEEVFVDEEVLVEWEKEQKKKDAARLKENQPPTTVDDEQPSEVKPKKTVKKSVKKSVKKKSKKEKDNARKLAEHNV